MYTVERYSHLLYGIICTNVQKIDNGCAENVAVLASFQLVEHDYVLTYVETS